MPCTSRSCGPHWRTRRITGDRRRGGQGRARRRRRGHRRRPRPRTGAAVPGGEQGDGPAVPRHRQGAFRRGAGGGRAHRAAPTRARTPPSWSRSTTTRCRPWSTCRTPLADEVAAVPTRPAPTSPSAFGLDEEFDEHLFDDCEVVVTREIVNQRLAAGAAGDARRRGGLGRRRAGHAVVLHAERADGPRRGRRLARRRAGAGARDHPGRRRRVRREDRRRPGVRAGRRGSPSRSGGRCAGPRPARRT